MKRILLSVVAASTLAAGCASTESGTGPSAERVNREYTTGSNIPKRHKPNAEGVQVYDREAFERERDRLSGGMRGSPGGGPPM